ncbi:hypothetical protein [Shewanella kaireitica]|uniref:hypothetical protein n=1 Tax=Shewanella kaireitica TaxID=212021 RepID=UPI00200D497F|nr:hypothetical protein [Shewanella kaireitica]MCL1096055.1 hypothetical protein [Shewanella kaireitica]
MFRQLIKQLAVITIIALMPCNVNAATSVNPDYDAKRAVNAWADEYGMKRYVIAFLKRGRF